MTRKERVGWVAFNSNLKNSINLLMQLKVTSRKKFDFSTTFSQKDVEDYIGVFRFELMRVQNYLARANYLLDGLADVHFESEQKRG